MKVQQFLQSIGERLQSGASVKTVYGEPIVVEEKTIIPVARIAYGFGGGLRSRKKAEGRTQQKDGEQEGGGAGLAASPVGVLEITQGETRFVSVGEERRLGWALIIGFFLGTWMGRRRSRT